MTDITINKLINVEYHRNGVCGIGFYAVDFVWSDYDFDNLTARAIIFAPNDDDGSLPSHYAITTEDVTDRWRGDRFIGLLWHAIKSHVDA
jgi:hypothetical protein